MAMTCQVRITRRNRPLGYDEETLIYTPTPDPEVLYEGPARIWELSGGPNVVVGDLDIQHQTTQLSIPWNTEAVISQYDEVLVIDCETDAQMVGKRYEVQTVAKAGQLRATRRFEVSGVN